MQIRVVFHRSVRVFKPTLSTAAADSQREELAICPVLQLADL
jgi:hypothetical protein